jgi:hypothetical protein
MLTSEPVPVKSEGKIVAEITVPVYESIEEACAELGTDKVLHRVNAQIKTDLVNQARAASQPNTSNKALREKAFQRVALNRQTELIDCAGDQLKVTSLIDDEMELIRNEIAADQELEAQSA